MFTVGDKVTVDNHEDFMKLNGYVGVIVEINDTPTYPIEVKLDEVDSFAIEMNGFGGGTCPFNAAELKKVN